MLDEASVSNTFWGEETQTSVYLSNRVILRPNNEKNPYELWKGRPTKIYHLKIFGRRCYIKRTKEKIVKFKPRVNEGILLGYSFKRKGYKCYNKRTKKVIEGIDIVVDEYLTKLNDSKDVVADHDFIKYEDQEIYEEEEEERNTSTTKNPTTQSA